MKNGQCPKCSGTSILGNVPLADTTDFGMGKSHKSHTTSLETCVAVARSPSALVSRDIVTSPIRAWICEACGFTEFYVLDAIKLGKAIDEAESMAKEFRTSRGQLPPIRSKKSVETEG